MLVKCREEYIRQMTVIPSLLCGIILTHRDGAVILFNRIDHGDHVLLRYFLWDAEFFCWLYVDLVVFYDHQVHEVLKNTDVTISNLSTWLRTHPDHASGWQILLYTFIVFWIWFLSSRDQSRFVAIIKRLHRWLFIIYMLKSWSEGLNSSIFSNGIKYICNEATMVKEVNFLKSDPVFVCWYITSFIKDCLLYVPGGGDLEACVHGASVLGHSIIGVPHLDISFLSLGLATEVTKLTHYGVV